MSDGDLIVSSLEHAAERCEDLAPDVYARHACQCPEAAALMSHMDAYMRGRMINDVLALLMTEPGSIDSGYLGFEVTSHRAYGVTPSMFEPLLHAVRDTVKALQDEQWNDSMEQAWNRRIAGVMREIEAAAPA